MKKDLITNYTQSMGSIVNLTFQLTPPLRQIIALGISPRLRGAFVGHCNFQADSDA